MGLVLLENVDFTFPHTVLTMSLEFGQRFFESIWERGQTSLKSTSKRCADYEGIQLDANYRIPLGKITDEKHAVQKRCEKFKSYRLKMEELTRAE